LGGRMRSVCWSLAFLLALCLVNLAHAAHRGVVRGNVPLRDQPSDRARVIAGLDSGETLVIERAHGKWVLVRAGSRQGWVRASRIAFGRAAEHETALAEVEPARHRRHRFGGARGGRRTRPGGSRIGAGSLTEEAASAPSSPARSQVD